MAFLFGKPFLGVWYCVVRFIALPVNGRASFLCLFCVKSFFNTAGRRWLRAFDVR